MIQANIHGCILALCSCAFILLVAAQNTDPKEVNALHAIKKRLVDPMKYLENWNDDPCASNWTGVFCSETIDDDGYFHILKLHLLNMNLSGSLAPELGELSHLKILDFMWNDLTGSIPKEIGNIASLQLLLLNGNMLSGSMPEELGYLAKLNRLQIDENIVSGSIPKSFGQLKSIKHLHLNNNSITGQLPSELSNLSTLIHLLVDNNNLTGYLPQEYSKLSSLNILQLDGNKLEGEVPTSYSNMLNLMKLSLRNCTLQGGVPDFKAWPKLRYIDLSSNQLTGPLPSSPLPVNVTTIILSDNHLNGSIPESFSHVDLLQRLSLENNNLTGSVPVTIWQNKSFAATAKLSLDLHNNSLSTIEGQLNPPANVSLRLQGNPICQKANIVNISLYCGSQPGDDGSKTTSTKEDCPAAACPVDNFYEYVPDSTVPCFCASPLRIGYRLKSPSFFYFPPYETQFKKYVTSSLQLDINQMYIDSYAWEEGPRLRMYLKLYPLYPDQNSSIFNASEVQRIRDIYTSWQFPGDDLFGPYELLNFTLVGPYSNLATSEDHKAGMSKGVIIGIAVAGIVCVVLISALISLVIARKRYKYQHLTSRKRLSTKISMKIDGVKSFSLKELVHATDNFNSNMQVGRGGYGKVFKGVLSNDIAVAIKRAEEGSLQGQKEFLTEIELLSRLHHRNLVSLLGYCDEQGEQMLIYEFMSNGTVREWIAGKTKRMLSFRMRLQIALGASKGILYLHTEAQPPIFHRDIKATNILLDFNLTAKVADFGLSKLAPLLEDEGSVPSHVSTVVKGTPGYLDPEYLLTRKLTDKSDVYSLGVVFLELLTGMQPIHHGKNIVREVNMANETGMMFSIIDDKMGSYPSECIERFVALALSCCRDKPERRPTMLEVVRELENILKMTPNIDTVFSESSSTNSSNLLSSASASASSTFLSREPYASTELSGGGGGGGELVSGVIPTIKPR